jgi:hypothetical protein
MGFHELIVTMVFAIECVLDTLRFEQLCINMKHFDNFKRPYTPP